MTVAGLIDGLKHYPPDLRVVVDGYEAGLDDPVFMMSEMMNADWNQGGGVYGCHALVGEFGDVTDRTLAIPVLVLARRRHDEGGDREPRE